MGGRAPHVHLADPDDEYRTSLARALRMRGARVTEFTSGAALYARALEERPDLVILETDLPEMHGFQVFTCLRGQMRDRAPRIAFVTGFARVPVAEACRRRGAVAYMTKSHPPDRVAATLAGLVFRTLSRRVPETGPPWTRAWLSRRSSRLPASRAALTLLGIVTSALALAALVGGLLSSEGRKPRASDLRQGRVADRTSPFETATVAEDQAPPRTDAPVVAIRSAGASLTTEPAEPAAPARAARLAPSRWPRLRGVTEPQVSRILIDRKARRVEVILSWEEEGALAGARTRSVACDVLVGSSGRVEQAGLGRSSGSREADAVALQAVWNVLYEPASRSGSATPVWIRQRMLIRAGDLGSNLPTSSPSSLQNAHLVRQVGDHAQELERLVAFGPVPVGRAGGDEHRVAGSRLKDLVADADPGPASENVLLVLDCVRVPGHPPSRLHEEAPQGEVRAFAGADQDLPGGRRGVGDVFAGDLVGVLEHRGVSCSPASGGAATCPDARSRPAAGTPL
jgi:TonB family protein